MFHFVMLLSGRQQLVDESEMFHSLLYLSFSDYSTMRLQIYILKR